MSFARQPTNRAQTAGDMRLLSPGRAGLTTRQAKGSLAGTHQCLTLGASPIPPAHLYGRPGQASGGIVLLAGSDNASFEAPAQPANLGPGRVAPRLTHRVAIEPTLLLQTADDRPPLGANALQQGSGRRPRLAQDRVGAAVQAVAGRTEPLAGQDVLRGSAVVPQAHPQRAPPGPIGPDQEDECAAIDRLARLAGIDPRQARESRGKRLRPHGVSKDALPPFPAEPRAPGQCQACGPGPVSWYHARPAVMRHGFQCLSQRDTTARGAIIAQGGERAPNQRWPRVPSCGAVGWECSSIASLMRNPCTA